MRNVVSIISDGITVRQCRSALCCLAPVMSSSDDQNGTLSSSRCGDLRAGPSNLRASQAFVCLVPERGLEWSSPLAASGSFLRCTQARGKQRLSNDTMVFHGTPTHTIFHIIRLYPFRLAGFNRAAVLVNNFHLYKIFQPEKKSASQCYIRTVNVQNISFPKPISVNQSTCNDLLMFLIAFVKARPTAANTDQTEPPLSDFMFLYTISACEHLAIVCQCILTRKMKLAFPQCTAIFYLIKCLNGLFPKYDRLNFVILCLSVAKSTKVGDS